MKADVNGVQRELTAAEEAMLRAEMPAPVAGTEDRIAALEEENRMLIECVLELSEIVYA